MASTDFVTESQIDSALAAVATAVNARKTAIGTLASLTTSTKTNLVAAINEVFAAVGSAGATINDAGTSGAQVWSSTKVNSEIAAAKASILGSASSAYDTLQEIQALMVADDTETTGILTALANRLRFDAAQTLTAPQKAQALSNLGIVASTSDFAATFNAAVA